MKKLLTILILLLAVVTQGYATETTLWEGTYSDGVELNSEKVATFKAGDVLRVYATVPEGGANFKICYKGANNNWSETTIPSLGDSPGQWPWINYNPGYYEFTLTAEDISALSDMNIYIYKGDNSSITKVSLVTADTPSYEGTVIYNGGDVVMGTAWDKYISLSAENFTDLNANAVIRIYIKDVLDDVQAVFQDGEWQDIEGVDAVYPANTDTYYELTLNSSVLATVKEKGLIVKGKNFTACAVSIMSTGTTVTTYTLNVTAENGSVTVKQGETDVTGTTTFAGGTELTLTANPSEGYIFEKWTIGETESTDNPLSVTMSEDKTIATVFKDAKILDWNHEYSTGNTGLTDILVNDRIQIVFTDESTLSSTDDIQIWQKDANWSGTQISSGTLTDKVYEFAVADEAMCTNIKERGLYIKGQNATFKELQVVKYYAVTITAPTNGTITIKNGDNVVNSGDYVPVNTSLTLTATPDEGYSFAKWTIGGEESTENPHTLTITEATSIAATFTANAIPAFSLDGFAADENNTYNGETHALTTTSEWSGMQLWIGNNSTYNGSKLVVKTAEDCKLKITVGYVGEGQAELSDEAAGKSHAVTLDNTKKIQKVIIQNQEAGTVTFSSMELDPSYTLTILSAENGSFTVSDGNNDITNGASVAYGTSLTLSATPSEGYSFTKWTIGEAESTENPHILTVTGDLSIAATFTTNPTVEPVFTDGKADLTKLESQNAEKVTVSVSDGKATVTTTEGWTGVQLTTTTADNVSGKELRITFAEAAKVKAYVKYSDETDKDSIMSEASTVLYLPIDDTKTVYQVQIQPTEATTLVISEIAVNAESTKPAEPVVTPVFTDGKADLSKLESQNAEKVTVSVADGKATVTTTEGWTGVQLTTTTADNVSGKELRITFAEAAKVKAYVKYSDETDKDSIMSEASTVLYLPIDDTKTVYQVQIQPTEATTLVISEIAMNAESTKPAEPEPTPEKTGVDISLTELNEGWNSTYDAATKTITTTGEWAARGWYVGDDRYNGKGSITVKFNAVDFPVTLKMEYTNTNDESRSVEAGAAAGETEVVLDIPDNVKTIEKVYITYQPVGTLTMTEATVNDKVVDNRTEKTLLENTQAIADGDVRINRGLFSNAVAGDIIRIYGTPGEGAKIALEPADYSGALDGANWTAFEESPFALKLTETVLNTIKEKGLLVRGENYTFTKAVLYTETALGNEIEDEEPEPEPQEPDEPTKTGIDISLAEMNEGWSSTYDAATKTITTTGEWAARGWYVGDDRYNGKGSITVKFNAVDFPVTLKMEYTNTNDESRSVEAGAAAGETEVVLDIPDNVKTIEKVYITYQPAGTLALTEATVNDKVVDNRTEKTLVENTQAIADGDIRINRGLFSNAVAGDIIRIYGTPGEGAKIALEPADYSGALDGANWTAFGESPFALKLTETVLNTIKEKDLLVRGENYTFNKAVLYTENELGEAIADATKYTLNLTSPENGTVTIKKGEDTVEPGEFEENTELTLTAEAAEGYLFTKWIMNGEDAGREATLAVKMTANVTITAVFDQKPVTIIDEKTGEVNLSEMTAQDVEAATVTVNTDDHSITITTTEPYKAAQIWFNEPEEVMENVLIVDIAEQEAHVTVTVKYTDGTESAMTSTTAGAQRSAARRTSTAGTQIVVPVDMGKKLQCIELKNALAGTLHVTKMVFTTQNVFTDGKANLSMAKAQSNATYDISTYTLATTKGWTGLTLTPLESEGVKGVELMVRFHDDAQVKLQVVYVDGTELSTIMDKSGRYVKMTLDKSKDIREVTIQPTTAGVIQLTELSVNQTPTPDEIPAPVFTNGKADLSRLTVQDASRVMYNTETCKMATTDGWVGVELNTTEAEYVSGVELAVRLTEAVKVKVAVVYNDGSHTDTIPEKATEETRLLLDPTKSIQQIQIQPTEAGALQFVEIVVRQTVTPEPEPVYFFNKEGVADLSQLLPMGSNATFNETNHQLTTTENWAGIQAWLENPQAVDGNVLSVKLAEENVNIKISVGYTDGTESTADGADTNATETGTEILVPNDATKEIQKVMIQMPEAGTVTLLSISSINFSVTELTEGENRLLWKNSQGAKLSWNNICKKDALYGAILKERQQLLVTVSNRDENNEWPKIFVRDANDQETGQVVELNSLRHYPYVVRITLTDEMVKQMADGFAICGDGVTVTSVYLYQPLPPQPGDINLIELNGGWNSTYDTERHIITTTSRWGACGWNIGDDRYNGMNLIQIGFEAVDFPVTLKMEYVDANGKKQATSAGIAAGRTTVELEIPEGIRQIDKVYLIWQQPGSVTLTSAEVSSTMAEALGIDLALFDPMGEKVSYDKQTYTMTTEEGYAGIQLWLGDANAIESPMLLELKTAGETAKLRVTVGYTDGTEASVDGEGANIQMELDDLRSIQKIMIQNMEAGTVTFNSLNITVRMPNGANAPAWNYIPVSGEGTYTVNGTKVSTLTKGLYIMDGKKIVIQ